jgi:hypothetical protein
MPAAIDFTTVIRSAPAMRSDREEPPCGQAGLHAVADRLDPMLVAVLTDAGDELLRPPDELLALEGSETIAATSPPRRASGTRGGSHRRR